MTLDAPLPLSAFAGFWRRVGAFLVDVLVLGAVGVMLGMAFGDDLARLGPWGRLVGFGVALVYFGVLNSRLGGGQTLGKRLLKVRVVGADGAALPVSRAVARFCPVGVAWFANNLLLPPAVLMSPWGHLLSLAVFGLGLSSLYLLVFNRPSRRTLHDWLVGSRVVPMQGQGEAAPAKRVHQVVVAALVLAAGLGPWFAQGVASSESFAPIVKAHAAVGATPGLDHVQVVMGQSFTLSSRSGQSNTHYLSITAYQADPDVNRPERARELATLALASSEEARRVDLVQVTLVHGYDIGIASWWRSRSFGGPPSDFAPN